MNIIVRNPQQPSELHQFVARLLYIFGEGVWIVSHKQPMDSSDLRVLAAALNTTADGLAHNADPELVRDRIERGEAPAVTRPVVAPGKAVLVKEVDANRRIVTVDGDPFVLTVSYMPSDFGEYAWNATQMAIGQGIGGFAESLNAGFAAATACAEAEADWDTELARRQREHEGHLDELEDEAEIGKFVEDNGYHPDEHYPGREHDEADPDVLPRLKLWSETKRDLLEALYVRWTSDGGDGWYSHGVLRTFAQAAFDDLVRDELLEHKQLTASVTVYRLTLAGCSEIEKPDPLNRRVGVCSACEGRGYYEFGGDRFPCPKCSTEC